MTYNILTRIFSYIYELNVEQSSSEYNPLLLVTLKNGRYRLLTENAIYSYEDLYDNFRTSFNAINLGKRDIKEVLVLGLGLGSIPFMIEKIFKKHAFITAVELDEEVIRLASKYTLKKLLNPFDIINADASVFIQITEEQYDLICVDVFNDDKIPSSFYEESTLENLKNILSDNGILLYNVLATTEYDIEQSELFFNKHFKSVFSNGGLIRTKHNYILVNDIKFLQ